MSEMQRGWPDERGLYRCKVNGEEVVLVHHYCGNTKRHWWTYTSGHDAIGDIMFDPEPVAVRKKKK